jgi:hypothetical protein
MAYFYLHFIASKLHCNTKTIVNIAQQMIASEFHI